MTERDQYDDPISGGNEELRARILQSFLRHVPYDGWSKKAFAEAASEFEDMELVKNAFPDSVRDVAQYYNHVIDERLANDLASMNLAEKSVRERIKVAILARLNCLSENREAVRRGVLANSFSGFGINSLKAVAKTVDLIWRAAGDTSTDYNFYSKRILLAGVYISTVLYWLDTDNEKAVSAFIDRRIGDVMRIQSARYGLDKLIQVMPLSTRLFTKSPLKSAMNSRARI